MLYLFLRMKWSYIYILIFVFLLFKNQALNLLTNKSIWEHFIPSCNIHSDVGYGRLERDHNHGDGWSFYSYQCKPIVCCAKCSLLSWTLFANRKCYVEDRFNETVYVLKYYAELFDYDLRVDSIVNKSPEMQYQLFKLIYSR